MRAAIPPSVEAYRNSSRAVVPMGVLEFGQPQPYRSIKR